MDSGYIHPDYHPQITHLLQEIDEDKPNLIITFGKVPFTLLTGQRLSEYRGTLCPYKNHWILPTLDIPTILKDFSSHPIVRADLNKAKRFLKGIEKVNRQVHIIESTQDLDEIKPKLKGVVAIDVETKDKQITCVSFSPSPSDSYVLPIWNLNKDGYHQWSLEEELKLWEFMFDILTGDCTKVFHNGIYDISYFTDHGIPVALPIEDTMLLHHAISPEMQKSLGFLGSLYCDETKLFRAVIYQALLDATKQDDDLDKQEAHAWFVSSSDFDYVCDLAELDPHATQIRALRVIEQPVTVTNFIRKRLNVLLRYQTSSQYS